MWATAWMHDANKVIAPLLGIPDLPVAPLPDSPEEDDPSVLHWKTRALVEFADGRAWVAAHHDGPALLHRVNATTGLTAADLATIADWCLLHWSTP
ncbi:hypothetical protein OHB11_22620 [Streptomyces zaomyceticus]|uniref:hypothetical protein n=1 Tax=Streptomyces zaomyceticus TaxID=68286 RepID=UPI00324D2160